MQNLIQVIDNEPRVSHRDVAEYTDNQQKNIVELIAKYRVEFEEFGVVPFKTEGVSEEKLKENPDAKPTKTYYLNEPQATFLMTLLRNKPKVVEFKKALVKAFYELKEVSACENTLSHAKESILIELVRNGQRQTDALIDLTNSVIKLLGERQERRPIFPDALLKHQTITPDEKQRLRDAMSARASSISKELGITNKSIAPGMWVEFKNFFDLNDYAELERERYTDAMNWIMFYEPRKKPLTMPVF